MPQQWRCPQGHPWSALVLPSAGVATLPPRCPTCDAAAVLDAGSPDATEQLSGLHPDHDTSKPNGIPVDATLVRPAGESVPPPEAADDATLYRPKPPSADASATLPPSATQDPVGSQEPAVDETLQRTTTPTPEGKSPRRFEQPALSGYTILGELGRGGMGVVYKARQAKLNRLTALKMILAGAHASAEDLTRFHLEAEAVAQLQHPNIVQIYEVGERNGLPFFSLEYIDGGSLQQKMNGVPVPPTEAAHLLETLARAVDYAHQRGIIHRDLKPANVLLTKDGTPKITDFGLAKRLEGDSSHTGTGAILGTPSYMAPEQARGRPDIGPAADVYALGAMLYDLLTGRPPFRADTVLGTLELVQSADPVPPGRLQPRVPRDLETICLKCLQKEPSRRYASALELADDLRRLLANQPILARRTPLWEKAYKWARRRPAVAALLMVLAMVLVGGFFGMFALWLRAEDLRGQAEKDSEEARNAKRRAVASEAEALGAAHTAKVARALAQDNFEKSQHVLYSSALLLAHTALMEGRRERCRELLAELEKKADPLRGFEWDYLWRLSRSDNLDFKGHTALVTQVAFSPGGQLLASASLDQTVKIWNPATYEELKTLRGFKRPVRWLAFSPDDRLLATAGADGVVKLWEWSVDADKPRQELKGHDGAVNCVAFAPDGKSLATASEDHTVKLWNPQSGQELATLHKHHQTVTTVAFSPKGDLLATGSEDRTVWLWDVASRQAVRELKGHPHWVCGVAFSPDGELVATATLDERVRLWQVKTGKIDWLPPDQGKNLRGVGFSPAGQKLGAVGADGNVLVWDVTTRDRPRQLGGSGLARSVAFSADGERLASISFDLRVSDTTPTLADHGSGVYGVAFSPDGQRLASASGARERLNEVLQGEVKIWDVRKRQELAPLRGHLGLVRAVAYSADGARLATASDDQTARLWNAADAKEVRVFSGHAGRVYAVAFRPGADQVATGGADGTARLWDGATGKCVQTFRAGRKAVRAVAFSPDGRFLATAGANGVLNIWDVAEGKEVWSQAGHEFAACAVAFGPDADTLVSGSEDHTVKVWHWRTQEAPVVLTGHTDAVTSVAVSRNGRRIVSGSEDQTVKVWDVFRGQGTLTLTLRGHGDGVTSVAFSADGHRLASGSLDQTVRLWDGTPLEEQAKTHE